jgi:hypothetical protein
VVLRVAILSEADIDEEITRTIIESLRGEPIHRVVDIRVQKRGWPAVREQVPAFIRHLYYRTDADALAVVVDADYSVIHTPSHEITPSTPGCRRCDLNAIFADVSSDLTPIAGRAPLRVAIGVAVPAIEGWLLVGRHHLASEAAWAQARGDERFSHIKASLKTAAYGGCTWQSRSGGRSHNS